MKLRNHHLLQLLNGFLLCRVDTCLRQQLAQVKDLITKLDCFGNIDVCTHMPNLYFFAA